MDSSHNKLAIAALSLVALVFACVTPAAAGALLMYIASTLTP